MKLCWPTTCTRAHTHTHIYIYIYIYIYMYVQRERERERERERGGKLTDRYIHTSCWQRQKYIKI